MRAFHAYLNFDGNAREAMTFYQQGLGAELELKSFAEAKMDVPAGAEQRILHARLQKGAAVLMASDTMPGHPHIRGTNFSVSIDCESIEEIERYFKAFSAGGTIVMPLADTFWNARFGMITDRFGIGWMFNHELPKQA